MKLAPLFSLLVASLLAACGPDQQGEPNEPNEPNEPIEPNEPNEPMGAPNIELGTGEEHFDLLPEDDAVLELVRGPQGGFHFDVAVRIQGVDPEGMTLSYQVTDAVTGALLGPSAGLSLRRRRLEEQDGRWLRLGDRAFLDIDQPAQIVGKRVRLEAALEGGETRLEDEVTGTVRESM